jgi:hypothetical protein
MAPNHKNLGEKLPQACRNTVLSAGDMAFASFELKFGFGWVLSAADAVHALTGLMVRHSMIGGSSGNGGNGGGGNGGGGTANGTGAEALPGEIRRQQADVARDDFWWAAAWGRGTAACATPCLQRRRCRPGDGSASHGGLSRLTPIPGPRPRPSPPPSPRDALSALEVIKPHSFKLLKEGIEGAKALQRAVIK